MHILYFTFGNRFQNHLQAAFSAISFLRQSGEISSINIVTDAAPFYKYLTDRVNIINVSPETIKEWRGPHDFFWRVKIKSIQQIAGMYQGSPVMYLDTDTFLYKDITLLKKSLLNGKAYMHEDEGMLSGLTDKTSKRTWQAIRNKHFGGMLMQPTDHMWNAGVVAFPNTKNGKDIELALRICDEMCAAGVPNRLVEQYALSLSLHQMYTLEDAAPWIAHYWSNKQEWDTFILEWLGEQQFKQKSFQEILDSFPEPELGSIPVSIRRRYTAEKLHRTVNRLFPAQNIKYIKKER